jgi:hypothetical protein
MTNSYEPVSTYNKRPFCSDHFELCNFKRVGRKQQILSTTLGRHRYRFLKSSVLALSLENQKDVNAMSLGYVSGLRNNYLHEIKMFIQRCKTVILVYNGSAFKFPTQFLRRNWRGTSTVTYPCIWTIISVGVILCDKRMLLENGLPYTLKSPNKQLMHTFLHFAVSLQSRFYQFRTCFLSLMCTFILLV